jgi:branched-subunit amino acid aminotransferase/4-amino-4-deoxychorismate lyase
MPANYGLWANDVERLPPACPPPREPNPKRAIEAAEPRSLRAVAEQSELLRLGFDEAILLDPQGMVAECTGENIFVVRRGRVITPPPGAILEGITRDSVMALARDLGHEVVEQPLSRDQLYIADEVFVTGTAAEVIGLREVDFRPIGSGRGTPVTRALQDATTRRSGASTPGLPGGSRS